MNDNLAAAGAGVTAGAVATPWVITLNEYLQAGVHIVALVAGIATAWYYIDRTLAARRARRGK